MIPPILYYIIVPFIAAFGVIAFLQKYATHEIPGDVARQLRERPIEKKFFRVVRRDHKGLRLLGDFETHGDAVDAAYQGRKDAQAKSEKAAFLVLSDRGEVLEEVDA